MPRKEYTIHYIYKITCRLNGKYYIGMHSTFDLEDGYMGSGKRIKRSIEKHGLENHVKEILEILPNRSSLKDREKEIVNEELLNDSLCINLKLGGEGGFSSIEHQLKCSSAGGKANSIKIKTDPNHRAVFIKAANDSRAKSIANGTYKLFHYDCTGRKHSEETKAQMRLSQSGKQAGSNNSQYGTIWITDGINNKKIFRGNEIPEGWKLGRNNKK